MTDKAEDKLFKAFTDHLSENFLKIINVDEKIVRAAPTELTTIDSKSRYMDYVGENENGDFINIEFQSTKITEEDFQRFFTYNILLGNKTKRKIKTYIICSFNIKNMKLEYVHSPDCTFRPKIISFKDINGDEKLNNIEDKLLNNEEIFSQEILELGLIPLMATKHTEEIQIEKIVKLLNKIEIDDNEIKNIVVGSLYLLTEKFIKDRNKRKRVMGALKMKGELLKEYGETLKEEGKIEGRIEGRLEGKIEGKEEGRLEGKIEGKEEGRIEGEIEGRLEGKIEGKIEGVKKVAKKLLAENYPLTEIIKLTGLSKKDIQKLK